MDAAPVPWLPTETTSFVGREAELGTIEELLGLSRLLTLTGPGGSGKSRLALRSGARASGRYADGIWLVELAPIGRPDLVVPAVALALSAKEEPGRTLLDSITARLRDSEALLILDNCEHVLDAVADLTATLLRSCPRLRILATVTALVDRSLLTTEERFGSTRYGMLESIHQYALGRLAAAGEDALLRRRHLAWLLDFAGRADLAAPDQAAWLDLLEAELDNFRAGLEWSRPRADRA